MKTFAAACMMGAVASARTHVSEYDAYVAPQTQDNGGAATALEVAEIIDGVFVGVFNEQGVDDLVNCITDFNIFFEDMDIAVKDFIDGSFEAVAEGIEKLGLAIADVGSTMTAC